MKDRRSDVIETAFEIGPDLAADIGPASAEREILAEISSVSRVDHALEQGEPGWTSGDRVVRMLAEELQRSVVRVRAHPFQHMAADHQKAGSGVAHPGKSPDHRHAIGVVDLEHIVE